MKSLNDELFPLLAKQNGFYKELAMRNLKWLHNQFKEERIEEDVYLALSEFNHNMDAAASKFLKEALDNDAWD